VVYASLSQKFSSRRTQPTNQCKKNHETQMTDAKIGLQTFIVAPSLFPQLFKQLT
jgi:hypothetical protein